jgi:hypothetical protein
MEDLIGLDTVVVTEKDRYQNEVLVNGMVHD